ncbi:MAG: phenylacetate--CoA ligase family protein [Thermoplasmata archaeon]|nr:phenylacetate--CoA ligase family protein [Thermoplasmata archaeon]
MNPFLNPVFAVRAAIGYYTNVNRIFRENRKELDAYRNKMFRKIFRYSLKVPLYIKKYKEYGVDVDKIKSLDDLDKLPFITKEDLRNAYPDKSAPEGFKGHTLITSGSTGKPVALWIDSYGFLRQLFGSVRELKAHGYNWRKTRMSLIGDYTGSMQEPYYDNVVLSLMKGSGIGTNHIQLLNVNEDPRNMIKKIEEFNPEVLAGYPGALRHLAFLREQGYGNKINVNLVGSCGGTFDEETRKIVGKAFDAPVFDVYGATEAGPIAFECERGKYHIHYDFVHLEFIDNKGNHVENEPAHIAVTRLYGKGTPIIRYVGIDDIVTPSNEACDCGIDTPLIKRIEGRSGNSIILPDGKLVPPSAVMWIPGEVATELNSTKIKRFQLHQYKPDEVEVWIVFGDGKGPSKDKLKDKIVERYEEKFEHKVKVVAKEVDEIKDENPQSPTPLVVSKIEYKNWLK